MGFFKDLFGGGEPPPAPKSAYQIEQERVLESRRRDERMKEEGVRNCLALVEQFKSEIQATLQEEVSHLARFGLCAPELLTDFSVRRGNAFYPGTDQGSMVDHLLALPTYQIPDHLYFLLGMEKKPARIYSYENTKLYSQGFFITGDTELLRQVEAEFSASGLPRVVKKYGESDTGAGKWFNRHPYLLFADLNAVSRGKSVATVENFILMRRVFMNEYPETLPQNWKLESLEELHYTPEEVEAILWRYRFFLDVVDRDSEEPYWIHKYPPLSKIFSELTEYQPPVQATVTADTDAPLQLSGKENAKESFPPDKRKQQQQQQKKKTEMSDRASDAHRYLQSLVKRIAEREGFLATTEKEVFGGAGKVDVALEDENQRIACEIAVTNTVEYELKNVRKCLAAGFDSVAVISPDAGHLAAIRRAAESNLSEKELARVYFLSPEDFYDFLKGYSDSDSLSSTDKVKGFEVTTGFTTTPATEGATGEAEQKARERVISDLIGNVMERNEREAESKRS